MSYIYRVSFAKSQLKTNGTPPAQLPLTSVMTQFTIAFHALITTTSLKILLIATIPHQLGTFLIPPQPLGYISPVRRLVLFV